jgi:mRNA-degrading endonuclease RelE of RelBE toxin-antitoxin system
VAKAKKNAGDPPNFRLLVTTTAHAGLKKVPVKLRARVQAHLEALTREGCRVAGYSLSGDDPWPKLCSKHIDDWRVIVAFPDERSVAVVEVGPHTADNDPYVLLAQLGGFNLSTAERTKPACCDDGVPPIDAELAARIDAGARHLSGRRRA